MVLCYWQPILFWELHSTIIQPREWFRNQTPSDEGFYGVSKPFGSSEWQSSCETPKREGFIKIVVFFKAPVNLDTVSIYDKERLCQCNNNLIKAQSFDRLGF
jgi:hypothetical protein